MKTLEGYRRLAIVRSPRCHHCGTSLAGRPIEHYPHFGGWDVLGLDEKQWLYITCPRATCGLQWSLWKLGVPREQQRRQHATTYH